MSVSAEIRIITPAETLPLRHEVLRPTRPPGESVYDGDDHPLAQHRGMFIADALIAIASIYQEPLPELVASMPPPGDSSNGSLNRTHWRLRGMAVSPSFQGQGLGRQLVGRCLQVIADQGGSLLWCNARKSAVPFYHAAGFEILGSEFDILDIGPHYVMLHLLKV